MKRSSIAKSQFKASLLAAMGLLACCLLGPKANGIAAAFELVAVHPEAALQPTELGKTLHTLHVAGDNLFVGYGDYNDDTGPITIRAYQIPTQQFGPPLIASPTESVAKFVTIGETVFAPTIDPLERSPGGFVYGGVQAETWSSFETLTGLHFFDIGSFGNNDDHLLLAGSGGPLETTDSFVYESLDGGATWNVSFERSPPAPVGERDFTRIYGVGMLDGKAYVQPVLFGAGFTGLAVFAYDGQQWTEGPILRTDGGDSTLFIDPERFGEELLVRNEHSGIALSPMFRFDGESLQTVTMDGATVNAWDQFVSGDRLYVLTENDGIIATRDLESWMTVLADVPENSRSVAVAGRSIYLGAGEGELYQSPLSSWWHNGGNPYDVDGLDGTSPLDALLVINELNDRVHSDPLTGLLPLDENPPLHFDVDDDWIVSPLDALLVINELPSTSMVPSSATLDLTSGGLAPSASPQGFDRAFAIGEIGWVDVGGLNALGPDWQRSVRQQQAALAVPEPNPRWAFVLLLYFKLRRRG